MPTLSRDEIDEIMKRDGIATQNREMFLRGVEDPLMSDHDRVEVFLLVIHNDRMDAIKVIEGLFKTVYPFRLTIYENSRNSRNTAKIWNKLTRESNAEFIMFIDSDCFPQNDIITPMVDVLERHPDAIAVGPSGGGSLPEHHLVKTLTITNNHLSGCCFMFRKSLWEKMPFDEDFVFYGQDSDWGQRILESAYKAYITPEALVVHGDSVSASKLKEKGLFDPGIDSFIARKIYEKKIEKRATLRQEAQRSTT